MSPVSKSPQTANIAEGRKYGQFSKFASELYCGFVTEVTLSWIPADFEEKVCRPVRHEAGTWSKFTVVPVIQPGVLATPL